MINKHHSLRKKFGYQSYPSFTMQRSKSCFISDSVEPCKTLIDVCQLMSVSVYPIFSRLYHVYRLPAANSFPMRLNSKAQSQLALTDEIVNNQLLQLAWAVRISRSSTSRARTLGPPSGILGFIIQKSCSKSSNCKIK